MGWKFEELSNSRFESLSVRIIPNCLSILVSLIFICTPSRSRFQLGVVFLEQGKASQALAYLDKALEFDPEHEQALLNSAILLQELGRPELRKIARERLLKLLAKDGK